MWRRMCWACRGRFEDRGRTLNGRTPAPGKHAAGAAASPGDADVRPGWRSILFVPGDRPDRYDKALAAGADAVCIDLEDAVAPERKEQARAAAVGFLAEVRNPGAGDEDRASAAAAARNPAGHGGSRPHIIVRVNEPDTREGQRDASVLEGGPQPDAYMVPKVRTGAGLASAHRMLGDSTALLPLIETALGLENAADIGQVSPAVAGLVFGGFDLAIELGAEPRWEALLYARSRVIHAAALAELDAIDMPSRDFREMSGLRDEAVKARRLGFSGKMAIHPGAVAGHPRGVHPVGRRGGARPPHPGCAPGGRRSRGRPRRPHGGPAGRGGGAASARTGTFGTRRGVGR